ncbi:cytochrome P450 [Melanomma pulvis-pyrius CBS 109.77]|uniref:Cytochrome P450 n=1 Tax=Melanomma pulvis-pyrius CBS 109.77 TaxID=1314802 RepID=A0A6A6XFG2_9PLEO|nr:cytochrome P450 [Melanomma pulvis-pyrius CBS 109.77]
MSPAFSGNSLRSKVPIMNKYIDLVMARCGELSAKKEDINVGKLLNWLCMDVAADLSCNWKLHQVRDSKNHSFLDGMEAASFTVILLVSAKNYPILILLAPFFLPWKTIRAIPSMFKELRMQVDKRTRTSSDSAHSDYLEQILPNNKATFVNGERMKHIVNVAAQLIVGGYDPTSVAIYMMFFFMLQNPEVIEPLKDEIRRSFRTYEDIDFETLRTLPWINACMEETLRLSASATHHSLPRQSPGGIVNGEYIPQGVLCRTSLFTYSRSERYFYDAKSFRPQRWLREGHPMYDSRFSGDNKSAHMPFITGPRQCPGREVARIMFRLIIAKIIWLFDIEQTSKRLDFERDFAAYGMWTKPELRVRLSRAKRESNKAQV